MNKRLLRESLQLSLDDRNWVFSKGIRSLVRDASEQLDDAILISFSSEGPLGIAWRAKHGPARVRNQHLQRSHAED